METHVETYHACGSCPHVSRSRDALRKHMSYRHPDQYNARKHKRNNNNNNANNNLWCRILSSPNGWYDMLWYCGVTFLFYFQDCSIRASPPLSWRRPSRGTCALRHTQDWIPRARASAMRRALVCRWLDRTQPILKSRWYCYTTFVASRMYCDMLLIWNYRLLKVCLKFKLCFSEFSPKQNGVVRLLTRLFDFSCSENVSNRGFWTTNEWSRSQKVFFKLIQTIIHVLFIFLNFFSWWFLSSSQWSQKLRKKTLKFLLQT